MDAFISCMLCVAARAPLLGAVLLLYPDDSSSEMLTTRDCLSEGTVPYSEGRLLYTQ